MRRGRSQPSPEMTTEILQMFACQFSVRKISTLTGLSRKVIDRIKRSHGTVDQIPITRCKGCGAKITTHVCFACRLSTEV